VWLDRGARTRPQLAGSHPLEEPLSALAPPLAARHTDRAALPSATFPHTLPAVCQIFWPFQLSKRRSRRGHGPPLHN
jgi:hypothetical protein